LKAFSENKERKIDMVFESYILPVLIFAGAGLIAGALLYAASKIFAVKADERLEAVNEALPGINCGACGYSGCGDYANAIIDGAPTNLCKAGGTAVAEKLAEILGVEAAEVDQLVAVVHCNGDCNATSPKYTFDGVSSCAAAKRFYGGSESCAYGCLGFGDCASVCPNGAISIKDGLAKVDKSLCVGCGLCEKACPKKIITMKSIKKFVDVACSSTSVGKTTKEICKVGCIACKICERKCPEGAIKVNNNLAQIDYSKCTSCGICAQSCPTHAIVDCRDFN